MRWMAGTLLVAALALGGCSDSDTAGGEAAPASTAIEARPLREIWPDILTRRDEIHAAISKGTDMWHEDCAQVSAAAAALDTLAVELGQGSTQIPANEVRRTGLSLLVSYLQTTAMSLREAAIEEHVAKLQSMMIGLDALLEGIETNLTAEERANQSVVTRPGFNPSRPPPPPSPV
jgi:phenylacetate-coenzyme A ligase PaaK-like adenylate-forming protein